MPRSADLIGRDEDLRALTDLVSSERIVTLVGPGGVGKTALARALLARVGSSEQAGRLPSTYLVPLAEVGDPADVRKVVARRLGLQDSGGRHFAELLGAGATLVLLDNCEHVVEAAAEVAAELLEVPGATVLATSREPLSVLGEHVFLLDPLPVPEETDGQNTEDSPAVQLFLRRAAAAGAATPGADERGDLLRLVRALDGLPLALELAAGRSRALSVRDLADRLDGRADLLRSAARGLPERHRSVMDVVEWSYRLLEDAERRLFLALSVCAGGAGLAAAEAVGEAAGLLRADVAEVLDRLVAKSLLQRARGARGSRYEMLNTLQSFARQRLAWDNGLEHAAREAHADHFAAACDAFQQVVRAAWVPGTFRLLLDDFDNIRLAASWCAANDENPDRAFRLASPLWYLASEMGSTEIAELTAHTLRRWPGSRHPLASEVGGVLAESCIVLGRTEEAAAAADAAATAATSPVGVAMAHRALAQLVPDVDEALGHLEICREAAAAAGYRALEEDALCVAVRILHAAGRAEDAQALAARVTATAAKDNVYAHATAVQGLGLMTLASDPEAARQYVDVAHDEWSALGCPYGLMTSVRARGSVETADGEPDAAAGWLLEALRRVRRLGYLQEQATTIAAAVPLLVSTGYAPVGAALLAGLEAAGVDVERLHAPLLAPVADELARQPAAAIARGRAMGMTELLDLAQRTLRELRAGPTARQVAEPPADERARALVRTGQLWSLTYDGTTAHLPATKGLADLAVLLRSPGREVAALDLAEPAGAREVRGRESDLGERIDAQARTAYRERIRVLQADLDDADAAGNQERAAAAQEELEALTAELASAYGLHGPRRTGDPAERARAAVTARIRSAVSKVAAVHPSAGRHLDRSVVTGRFCVYRPETETVWEVSD